MKEKDFQRWVIEVARALGWKVWHVPAPMQWVGKERGFVGAKEAAGLADLIMVHTDKKFLVFMEVKGTKGRVSDKQIEFQNAVSDIGENVIALTAWPGDEETVERILARPEAVSTYS